MQPEQQQSNYDFIMQNNQAPKRPGLGGNSKAMRIAIVVGGATLLLIIGVMLMSFLSNAGAAFSKPAMLAVAQDQTEIARLSEAGADTAVSARVKNFAITTKLSMQSGQKQFLTYLAQNGYEPDPKKELGLKADPKADEQLTAAESSSTFDSTFTTVMTRKLQTYQADLKAAYDGANPEAQAELSRQYDSANLLLNQLGTN